ncbi:CCA tRNA nucleotidyltransferase, mitochondrial [Diplodia seriata]|uniref:CCA tRNA nucleotidyltransferase, mitochondrial n=1 Tax=Diplodia seriata TaxID=420778 RepID=A0A1S8BFL3_9PEZI|nr:CCA tRNA nucleotidyltransferase, mitochondrial [Diplodia seriata]
MTTQAASSRTLELTEVEQTLRRLLLDVAEYIDNNPPPTSDESHVQLSEDLANAKLVLRFTGGWVRDKLLGVESHDIDVAINKMTGYQFGLRLKEYLEIPGNPEKYGLEGVASSDKAGTSAKNKQVGGLHKIEANPEKSKHLETVTTRILGLDIDLVNLRKETYSDDSRNPQMEFGTPEEDALRRDATVNAMFYNLNTSEVEDFTGKGFEDMELRIIRTPLEPYQTFKDDPLRVLRLIRFASRLGYSIEPSVEEFMGNEDIKKALHIKISRERVGVELEKALKGPDPLGTIQYIDRLGLYTTVFSDPTKDHNFTPPANWPVTYQCLSRILQSQESTSTTVRSMTIRDAEDSYLSWLISAIVPWADAPEPQPLKPGTKAPPPVACSVAREGIKAPNKVCDVMTASVRNLEEIRGLKDKFNVQQHQPHKKSESDDATAPDTVGMAIRKWGPSWRNQALFVLLYEVLNLPEGEQEILRSYSKWFEHIQKLNLTEAYALKPLLDGKALAKALETPPGPWMKSALEVVMAWQLRNPGVTDSASAIEEVRIHRQTEESSSGKQQAGKKKGELTSHLASHFLRLTIRPLFAKTQNPAVTAQGRKSIQSPGPRAARLFTEDESESKPWKGKKEGYALELLRWVLLTADSDGIEKIWPLVVPPVLALLDDSDPKFKAKGCDLLRLLLEITPPSLLKRTGLAKEFKDTLFPCLTYLPSLTPETESITLLNAAYPALISLARTCHPVSSPVDPLSEASHERAKSLDELIWEGILFAHAHAGEHVRIAQCLFTHLASIINELGMHSVKHLKNIVPLLSNTLSEPLGPAYPPLPIQAARTMQVLILNSWMRMEAWRADVLKGLSVCWVRLAGEGEEKDGFAELKAELRKALDLLRRAVDGVEGVEWEADTKKLSEADARLEGLFA